MIETNNTQDVSDSWEDQERALLEEFAEMEKAEREKFEKALEYFRENGIYKGEFETSVKEWLLSDMDNQHVGYVDAIHIPEEKNTGFRWSPTERFFRLSDESAKEYPKLSKMLFSEQVEDVDDDTSFTYLVHQWCYFEDDYRGYLLLPLKDGRFWLIFYVC